MVHGVDSVDKLELSTSILYSYVYTML